MSQPVFRYNDVSGNDNFQTFIYNIGFEIGPGNPNAEILQWINNNTGEINNVQLWSDDSNCADGLGIHNAYPGPTMIRNLAIYGCSYGVDANQAEYSVTFDGLTTEGQTAYGVYLNNLKLSVQHWLSDNPVTAWYEVGPAASAAVLDSEMFFSGAGTIPGVINLPNTGAAGSSFYARNVASSGYSPTEADSSTGSLVNYTGNLNENWSGQAQSLFNTAQTPASLRLPEAETPLPSVGDPSGWTELGPLPSTWCTTIQNSSSSAVYLPPGVYTADANVACSVPDSVNLIEMYGSMYTNGTYRYTITFTVAGSSSTPLVIDGCEYNSCYIVHTGTRTLAVTNSGIGYQDTPGVTHTVFFEDDGIGSMAGSTECAGNGPTFYSGTTVYGRQFDDETGNTTDATSCWKFTADGAKMWLLGYKTEQDSPSVILTNQAQAEIFGFFFYQLHENPAPPNSTPILLTDSSLFATGYMQNAATAPFGAPNWVVETQGDNTYALANPNVNISQTLNMYFSYGATAPPISTAGPYLLDVNAAPVEENAVAVSPLGTEGYYAAGTVVNLTATAGPGFTFTGWSGSVANPASAQTTITMSAAETVTANFAPVSPANGGGGSSAINVGSTGPVQTFTYTFANPATLAAVSILTSGAPSLDYTDGGSSTCTAGMQYAQGQSCVVTVAFTPSAPGFRPGAAVLFAQGSTLPLATFYLNSVGQAPAATIDPGTQTTPGSLTSSGVASSAVIDGLGNIYVADSANSQVIMLATGSFAPSTVLSSGLLGPTSLAEDGAGNLYLSDSGNSRVVMVPNEQGTLNPSDLSALNIPGLGTPGALAIDGSGNVFVADTANGSVIEIPQKGSAPFNLVSGLTKLNGIAVDASDNLYVASANLVNEYPSAGGTPIPMGTGYTAPSSLTLDASGELCVLDSGQIYLVAPGGAVQTVLPTTVANPGSISLDASANLYITSGSSVYEVNRNQAAPLTFVSSRSNPSSSPQTLTVSNAGNAPMAISTLTISPNFTQATLGGLDCAAGLQVAAADACSVVVTFTPTLTGALTGSVTLANNALNAAGMQTVPLAGGGSYLTQTITFAGIPTQPYGVSAILDATADSGLPITYSVLYGPATLNGNELALTGVGIVAVQASQPGSPNYSAATPVVQTFAVNPATQTIVFPTIGNPGVGASVTVSATASSELPVAFASTTPSICTVNGSSVTTLGAGQCILTASQPGNADYLAAYPVTQKLQVLLVPQTITFPGIAVQLVGANVGLVASASSQLPVTFNVTTPAVCVLSGTTITTVGAGTCTVQASQAGDLQYAVAPTGSQSFGVNLVPQTITFAGIAAQMVGASVTLTATASSSLTVSFGSTTPTVCTVTGNAVAAIAAGTCRVQAAQAGNTMYKAASAVTDTFAVNQGAQTITFAGISGQLVGASLSLLPTASSGLPVTLSSTTTSVCALNGSTVSTIAAGTCSIQASQAGNAAYKAAPTITQSFTVSQTTQSITFATINSQFLGVPVTLSATASSQLPVTFTITTPAICSVSGTILSTVAVGTCTVQASQAGNASYKAATTVAHSFNVTQGSQTITFAAVPAQTAGNAYMLVANASSQLPVTFATTTGTVCTVSANSVSTLTAGTCTIQASQAGNTSYLAAPTVTQSFSVNQMSQTINFGTISTQTAGTTVTLSAIASSSLPVTYATTTPTICSVSGNAVSTLLAGYCSVQASQAGNTTYKAATTINETFAVTQTSQSITFATIPAQLAGSTYTMSASASSGLPVTLATTTPGVCSVSGTSLSTLTMGTCTVQASQSGNITYKAAPTITQTVSSSQRTQTITFSAISPQTAGSSVSLTATSSAGLPVSFATTSIAVCTVNGSTVTALAAGTCSIQASQPGNTSYKAAPVMTQSFSVTQQAQAITFPMIPAQIAGNSVNLTATANSGLPVTYAVTTPSICSVSGGTIATLAPGNCSVQASQPGNAAYKAATTVTQSFAVTQTAQTISFASIPGQAPGATMALTATASSQLPVSLATSSSTCSISGTTLTTLSAGTCSVVASQAGNITYKAAPNVTQSFAIAQESQTITFPAISAQLAGTTVTLAATANSGLPITYSTASSACSVSGSTVATLLSGTCTITASQAGNTAYKAASNVNQSFAVSQAAQTITFSTMPAQLVGSTLALSASANSQLPVTFATASSACTVSGATVTTVAAGTCSIQATQAGNITYKAAPTVTQSFGVSQSSQSIQFTAITGQLVGATVAMQATASSQLPVTFTTSSSACTINGTAVTTIAAGSCNVQASQAGNATYKAAPNVSQSFIVTQSTQTITFPAISSQSVGGSVGLAATATSGLAVSFTTSSKACSISGTTLTAIATGTCSVVATQAGNAAYKAAPAVTESFTVAQ